MERKLPQRHKVFLYGVLVGLISLFAFWTIIFTTLGGGVKLSVFLGSASLSAVIQIYALRELKKPGFWQRYNWSDLEQEIRNYRWFGIFLFGVFSPLIFSFFGYVVLKNL